MSVAQHIVCDRPRAVPIFKEHGYSYRADACRPLIAAVEAGQIKVWALARGHYPGSRLPADALPALKTLGHWDAQIEQQWGLPWHRNEGIEISFLETGTLDFGVDGRGYVLQADALTVTRPWQLHRIGNPNMGPNRLHWIIVDVGVRRPNQHWKWPDWVLLNASEIEELSEKLRHNEQPVWQASVELRHCFESMARCIEQNKGGVQTSRLAVRINDLLLLLLDLLRSQNIHLNPSLSGSRRTVQMFLDDLAAHPDHLTTEWTVEQMAHDCGLKSTQFSHYVKQVTNVAPMHYLNRCRLDFAAKLLAEEAAKSITQVAFASGFSSSQYFATLFKGRFKMSPKEFRCFQAKKRSNDS